MTFCVSGVYSGSSSLRETCLRKRVLRDLLSIANTGRSGITHASTIEGSPEPEPRSRTPPPLGCWVARCWARTTESCTWKGRCSYALFEYTFVRSLYRSSSRTYASTRPFASDGSDEVGPSRHACTMASTSVVPLHRGAMQRRAHRAGGARLLGALSEAAASPSENMTTVTRVGSPRGCRVKTPNALKN